jgi:hypothetical protein
VSEGFILEVCLAKWWASAGNVDVTYSVTFQGVAPEPKEIVLHGAESIARVDLSSRAQVEVCSNSLWVLIGQFLAGG